MKHLFLVLFAVSFVVEWNERHFTTVGGMFGGTTVRIERNPKSITFLSEAAAQSFVERTFEQSFHREIMSVRIYRVNETVTPIPIIPFKKQEVYGK